MELPSKEMWQLEALWSTAFDRRNCTLKEACKEWGISVKYVRRMATNNADWKEVMEILDKERSERMIVSVEELKT